jgi:hypothetical protein
MVFFVLKRRQSSLHFLQSPSCSGAEKTLATRWYCGESVRCADQILYNENPKPKSCSLTVVLPHGRALLCLVENVEATDRGDPVLLSAGRILSIELFEY